MALKQLSLRSISQIDRMLGPKVRLVTVHDLDRLSDPSYRRVAEAIEAHTGGAVGSGPFKGMTILDQVSWGSGDRAAKLLGCYEQELHGVIEDFILSRPAQIINIGCAEGYYSVGLALRLPDSRVAAVDVDEAALAICDANAVANGVTNQLTTMLPDALDSSWTDPAGALWVVDVEGAEADILDPIQTPALRSAMVLVECHDFVHPHITEELRRRFSETHLVRNIIQSSRNPGQYAVLRNRPESERWAAVNERRPCVMNWLAMTPILRPRQGADA